VLGSEASVGSVAVSDLHAWREGRYRAGALVLVGAGKLDHDALVALAESRFADLPEGTIGAPEAAAYSGGARIRRTASDQAHLALGFPAPAQRAPDYFAARFFSDIVGGGMSSRLFQQLREDRGLAYSVYSALHAFADSGLFYIYAATARREAAAAARLIEDVIARAAEDASQRELDRVRMQARASLLMSLETPWGQAHYVARQLAVYGRLVEPAELVEELDAVTLGEVRAAGAAMLAGPRARATIGVPAARAA
jgi:predicted Zn-dependent peptidase